MKSLKFRVWSGNMFIDGNDFTLNITDRNSTEVELKAVYPHKELTICLWTGLKDKNGKEIYEGDILKFETLEGDNNKTLVGEVYFYVRSWYAKVPTLGCVDFYGEEHSEVIGNIWEHPHLLK